MSSTPRIINTHDQLVAALVEKHPHPFAIMTREHGGLIVYHPSQATDPTEKTCYNPGYKAFHALHYDGLTTAKRKAAALQKAKDWVRSTYGYTGDWKRNHMRDYVPADINAQWPLPKREKA